MSLSQPKTGPYQWGLTIMIPAYNEEGTLTFLLNKLIQTKLPYSFEIIIVDDGSTDGTTDIIRGFLKRHPQHAIRFFQKKNQGKGSAIRLAVEHAQGEILIVQDADLEYDPNDIPKLLVPFSQGAKVVYGSRNLNKKKPTYSHITFYLGGLFVTYWTNFLFGSQLTDEATGYKLFHASLFKDLNFKSNGFAWEPEITAKILKKNIQIHEIPIYYNPRDKKMGKKITWHDGTKALWTLLKEYFKK